MELINALVILCLEQECQRHVVENIDTHRFAINSHRFEQVMLCGEHVVVLYMINYLFSSLHANCVELNSSSPWLPFKIVQLVK